MAKSDEIPEQLLFKTYSGKLVWKNYKATIGEIEFYLSLDEGERPELTVQTQTGSGAFYGPTVNDLYDEVKKLAVLDDPDLMNDLANL